MEYTVNRLAQISGVSKRTLRYYDEIGLLRPERVNPNGYRIYGQMQVDLLQQILFYRELGLPLEEIREIIKNPGFDREKALEDHLTALLQKKRQTEILISNVKKTLDSMKGRAMMSDEEKFEGFKRDLIKENEENYGREVRKAYGEDAVDASNERLAGMSREEWNRQEELSKEILETLKAAMEDGSPAGETAQKACDLHRQWLCMFWGDGAYSREAHREMGEMYAADERFKAYYDKVQDGAAEFLRDALNIYCS